MRGLAAIAGTSLPRQPRLPDWLTFVELGDGRLQMRAADFAYTVPDPLLADVVRRLRPLLDGTRSVEELAASGGSSHLPGTIQFVLKMLRQRGVLQEGAPPPDLDAGQRQRFRSALRLLAHYVVDAEQVVARLQGARISLTGEPELCRKLSESLESVGVGHVCPWALAASGEEARSDLLIAAARTPATAFFESVNDACLGSGGRWTRVAFEGRLGVVGPTIVPAQTACYRCLVLRQSTYDVPSEFEAYRKAVREIGECNEGELDPLTNTIVAQTVLEVARLLSGFAPPVTFGRQYVYDAGNPRVIGHDVLRVPRCPSCAGKQSPRDPWDMRRGASEIV